MKTEGDLGSDGGSAAAGPHRPGTGGGETSTADSDGRPVTIEMPETLGYRIKRKLLGEPLATEELAHEKLGKPTALAVFASDNLSSCAYATEEILHVLVPVVGIAAFSLVMPITVAMIAVLGILILSYRQTIRAFPAAAGAYNVTKASLGRIPSVVAGVALLTDYILTVAVSIAAGTAAIASAVSAVDHLRVQMAVFFIALIAYGNLRGAKESGRIFSVPTYFFLFNMGILLFYGLSRMAVGELPVESLDREGLVHVGTAGDGLLYGAALFVVLRAFASGGAAVTGVEAISDGVPAFRAPAWRNARTTLAVMGSLLAVMFFGLSLLASRMHTAPFEHGTPTVLSQVATLVYGSGPMGEALYYTLQLATMLILIMAANTAFADFPRLANFAAADRFMPRQLTKRGHRLVFSNGIVALAASAAVLIVATGAKVERLIPLYAIGVFTSFTMSQTGMARHHLATKEPGWQRGLVINGTGAGICFVVAVIIAITKFAQGGWVIIAAVPVLSLLLLRLNRQYTTDADELKEDASKAAEAPVLRRHVVVVLVDNLDLAAARAVQYARTLNPDQLRAVHFALDHKKASDLADTWGHLGLSRIALDIVECPDRRLAREAVELVAELVDKGDTEVSVLIPRVVHRRAWHKFLHDRTSDDIAAAIGALPHANVTFVPYHLGRKHSRSIAAVRPPQPIPAGRPTHRPNGADPGPAAAAGSPDGIPLADVSEGDRNGRAGSRVPAPVERIQRIEGTLPLGQVRFRQHVTVHGRVHAVRVQPRAGVPTYECVLEDGTGRLTLVFLGRRSVPGMDPGAEVEATAVVGKRAGGLEMLNPTYRFAKPVSNR